MSTSGMNKEGAKCLRKTAIVYLLIAAICIAVTNIYALFGHGVRSGAMDFMFLYPLLGGTLVYFLLFLLFPTVCLRPFYRITANLYNCGIATLTSGAMLKGIFDIAGTASRYVLFFEVLGWALIASGICVFLVATARDTYD